MALVLSGFFSSLGRGVVTLSLVSGLSAGGNVLLTSTTVFAKTVVVAPGNRNVKQPRIPYGSVSRTRSTSGSFEGKYQKIRNLLAKDKKLIRKIKSAASRYRIDPIHIVGSLVGEHTYNVDALDHLQTYYVKAASYLGTDISFKYDGEHVTKFVDRPQFAKCKTIKNSYDLWACREQVWKSKFRGKTVDGKSFPNDRFGKVFFQPLFAGQTFGLGQLNPLTALRVNDKVNKVSGYKKLSAKAAPKVYASIMDPDKTLHYMAAIIRVSIDAYQNIAGVDISKNPGVTATLYNLGNVKTRAYKLKARRKQNRSAMPEENYYGWLINKKEKDLRSLL